MNTQIANIGIVVKDFSKIADLNSVLHEYSNSIVSRCGMPYKERNVRLINIMIDASAAEIADLKGKLSSISGISAQIMTFDL